MVSNGVIDNVIITGFFYILKEIFLAKKNDVGYNSNKIYISSAIAVSAIFINLWPIAPSGNFFNNWLSMIYFYPIGFI